MATTIINRTDISGASYTLDVIALELSSSLSTLDFEVTHNGIVNNNYTKTSAVQLTYAGTAVTLGTRVVARKISPLSVAETTFISTTTASQLTNSLNKLRQRTEELEARLSYALNQISLGGITLGALPVNDAAFAVGWDGDTNTAPSRNAVYDKFTANDTQIALRAPIASPVFTGDARAVTPATTDNDTSIATTAFFVNALQDRIKTATVSGNNVITLPNNLRIVHATNTGTTNAAGVLTVNFGITFASTPTVVVCNGDTNQTPNGFRVETVPSTTSFILATSAANTAVRYNYVALGVV